MRLCIPHAEIELDRFALNCPNCTTGKNSRAAGGSETCFHCCACEYVECLHCDCFEEED